MFVQALAAYADRELSEQLNQEAWEEKPVPYYLAFRLCGNLFELHPQSDRGRSGQEKRVSVAAPLMVPRSPVPRNAGLHPLLAADDIKYVLGAGSWTPEGQQGNNQQRHEAFVSLFQRAAADTEDEGLKAAALFYSRSRSNRVRQTSLGGREAGNNRGLGVGGASPRQERVSRSKLLVHALLRREGRSELLKAESSKA